MTTTSLTNTTRRGALKLFGATAAIATPGIALAATKDAKPLLALDNVPLAWPTYHKLASFDAMPQAGDEVVLEADKWHPANYTGIAVYTKQGEKIGYVTNQNVAALDWAMKNGSTVEAKIAAIDVPVVRSKRVPGWGAFKIDVSVKNKAALV